MKYKKIVFCLLLIMLLALSCETPLSSEVVQTVKVIKVVDGDTIDILFSDGTNDRVRMIGIDTPETYGENDPEKYKNIGNDKYLKAWGQVASEYSKERLLNQEIVLQFDSIAGERGYYGRLLAYVILNNKNYNEELIIKGLARAYSEGNCELQNEFLMIQAKAEKNGVGLWSKNLP